MLTRYKASIICVQRQQHQQKNTAEKKNLCVTKLKLYFHNARAVFHLIFCRCLNWKPVSAAEVEAEAQAEHPVTE